MNGDLAIKAARTTLGSVAIAIPAVLVVVAFSGRGIGFDAALDTFIAGTVCLPLIFWANYTVLVRCGTKGRDLPAP